MRKKYKQLYLETLSKLETSKKMIQHLESANKNLASCLSEYGKSEYRRVVGRKKIIVSKHAQQALFCFCNQSRRFGIYNEFTSLFTRLEINGTPVTVRGE